MVTVRCPLADGLNCGPFAELGTCVRRIVSIICFIACLGPLLFVVGIIYLVMPNDRKERVGRYNDAVALFDAEDSSRMQGTAATAMSRPLALQSQAVEIVGDKDGIDPDGMSVFLQGTVTRTATDVGSITLPVTTTYGTQTAISSSITVPNQILVEEKIECGDHCSDNRAHCTSRGTIIREYQCGVDKGIQTSTGDRYDGGPSGHEGTPQYCIDCNVRKYLRGVCTQMSFEKVGWRDMQKGCFYPFDRVGVYEEGGAVAALKVTLRSENDPFIALQQETKGTRDFGITAAKQRTIGIVLIVVGLLICVCMYGGIGLAVYCVTGKVIGMCCNSSSDDDVVVATPVSEPKGDNYPGYPEQKPTLEVPPYPPQGYAQPAVPYQQPQPYPQQYPQSYPQPNAYPQQNTPAYGAPGKPL